MTTTLINRVKAINALKSFQGVQINRGIGFDGDNGLQYRCAVGILLDAFDESVYAYWNDPETPFDNLAKKLNCSRDDLKQIAKWNDSKIDLGTGKKKKKKWVPNMPSVVHHICELWELQHLDNMSTEINMDSYMNAWEPDE